MHVVFRESHGLEETETPTDLGQSPADLVVLSYSDSDLGAFAAGWHRGGGPKGKLPSLRLANLSQLRHPLSVDTYVEQTLAGAKGILVRLIGGRAYWPYGLTQLEALAARKGLALAVLPADGRPDETLDLASTLPVSTLRRLAHLCDTGGAVAAQAALAQLSLAAGLYAGPVQGQKQLPTVGAWAPALGACCPLAFLADMRPRVVVTFYRAYLTAADTEPLEALFAALDRAGFQPIGLFAPTLKAPQAAGWLSRQIAQIAPCAIVNATAFSGQGPDGTSPLDAGGVPVFQVALTTSSRDAWHESERGLSPADLAMHVVLPEIDGRLFSGAVSFKEAEERDPHLQCAHMRHRADPALIASAVEQVTAWTQLAARAPSERRPALVLSTYPGKDWNMAHAVGLDALASAQAILEDLSRAGHDVHAGASLDAALASETISWPLSEYEAALARLPQAMRADLAAAWGAPQDDPVCRNGAFHFAASPQGAALVALQPERGSIEARGDEYHDLARVPRHSYVAFYLWLQSQADVLIHIGAHGTLEWLPGKAVALGPECWPRVLTGSLPVIYPFIVNDPGEAAQAKRRIGALTLGHLPPPLRKSATPERLSRLEALLDEFSNADGLDPRRRDRLQDDIRGEAQALGVEDDLGLDAASSAAEAITRIDRFVCDIKDSQFGDGLHVWGRPHVAGGAAHTASLAGERQSIADALNGRRIAAGPSGSPFRGRTDVLPTGRNLFATDPRAVPTRSAHAQGVKLAEELVRRHLQDHGDWPRGLIVDLWGSATIRTAGEEFAMALHLLGVRPVWDAGSERVSGIEVLPITDLDRPRLDVSLRVSGLFRDIFPTLTALFAQAVRALAGRDEAPDWNPFAGKAPRAAVFGPAPGSFGLGINADAETYGEDAKRRAGEAWLEASAWVHDGANVIHDPQAIRARVRDTDSFVHLQDLPETDLLMALDYATHEAGFAAAQGVTGGKAALYHLDNTDPARPRARGLAEEIARVVQARAANPDWLAGMMRHGFRGAAEIAATLDHMAAFAHLAGVVSSRMFDLYYEATLGEAKVESFLRQANPGAHAAMQARFAELDAAGLWETRRNSIRARLEAPA
ncbi:cobaltochelatase subunit CobN [Sulfitobacter sp. D35]|uniref:cobaltochelatase subunit CobN n=1 Tax=Sulfitobacter sp. D35 TaxID=3083252 RepID=UPI00296F0613|nr:cobaltochelatase subunit CobN [Sulfitobacter sp. D35]MDW4496482.1 cobaltochelatase subunit CobN [Sulfitobacter sp. D35]